MARGSMGRAPAGEFGAMESLMLRYALLVVAVVAATGSQAVAQEVGRYQIVIVPFGLEGEGSGTTVLLDTQTGRTWHAILDDKGRPRWRGIELAGGSQALAEAPDQRLAAERQQAEQPEEPPQAEEQQ
jgi:hypothetical protein